ncbi:MAG: BTAD domain-containing putative transcriptional regulator [Bacillota bacterium]
MRAQDKDSLTDEGRIIQIYTLGRFLIKRGSSVISDEASRSKKAWDLFKYLIAHREKTTHSEAILEALWPDQIYTDSNLAMRSLIFRLRQLLEKDLLAPELALNITFAHGCYRWQSQFGYWLDVEQFEKLCTEAHSNIVTDPRQSIDLYLEAVSLYKGDFLPESSYQEWILPFRNHYQRVYLQAVFELIRLLKNSRRIAEIIAVCEKALMIEYYEEELHLHYIEALLEEGKTKQARVHYDEVTATFYRDLGAKPSAAMRNLFRVLKMEHDNFDLDLTFIQEGLRDRQAANGAFYCDADVFRQLYKLERFRGERTGQVVFLGLMTITLPDYRLPPQKVLDEAMATLQDVLVSSLRKGDVITRWNKAQYLILLPWINIQQADIVLGRVEARFVDSYPLDRLVLHKKQQPLLPAEPYIAE